jgi:hypothetical protein
MPASPSWRAFTVAFFKFLSAGSQQDSEKFAVPPNPVRLMPGGLGAIVEDGLALLGSGNVSGRGQIDKQSVKAWLRPISAEKLVYRIVETDV